jgi:hypothetical protein
MYEPSKTHLVANTLSCLLNTSKPQGLPNQTIDAPLFMMYPNWLAEVKNYLHMNIFPDKYPLEYNRRIALKVLHFTIMDNTLHYLGQDMVLWHCLDPK